MVVDEIILDLVRDLKRRVKELETENDMLRAEVQLINSRLQRAQDEACAYLDQIQYN